MPPLTNHQVRICSLSAENCDDKSIAVIIDVYRAFTTAAIALSKGAGSIIMVDDVEQALALREQGTGSFCMGERHGQKLPGFDFGNSPAELANQKFDGETIIQTTTNGTRGVIEGASAHKIFAASLVTAEATAQCLTAMDKQFPIVLAAMGHKRRREDEDELCALYLRSKVFGEAPDKTALAQYLKSLNTTTGPTSRRSEPLLEGDVEYCLDIDSVPFAISIQLIGEHFTATKEFPPAPE